MSRSFNLSSGRGIALPTGYNVPAASRGAAAGTPTAPAARKAAGVSSAPVSFGVASPGLPPRSSDSPGPAS